MARLAISETVNAPLGRTFEAFSDLRSAEKNISGIKRLEILTDGPIGKGTRFKETRVMFGREATETMEVTQWEPRGSPGRTPSAATRAERASRRSSAFIPSDRALRRAWRWR